MTQGVSIGHAADGRIVTLARSAGAATPAPTDAARQRTTAAAVPRARSTAVRLVWLLCPPALIGYYLFADQVTGAVLSGLVMAGAIVGTHLGGRWNTPDTISRWALPGCGVLFAVGVIMREDTAPGSTTQPWSDLLSSAPFTFGGYALLVLYLISLLRRGRHRAGLLLMMDATATSLGLAIVIWIALIVPTMSGPLLADRRALELAFVGVDVLLLSLAIQVGFRQQSKVMASWLLMAGLACLLIGDLGYALGSIGALTALPEPALGVWHLAAFVFVAGTALHPSSACLASAQTPGNGLRAGRLAVLYLALIAPTALVVLTRAQDAVDAWFRVIAFMVLVSLVFARTCMTALRLAINQSRMRHLAHHDDLTGLLNRKGLFTQLRRRSAAGGPGEMHVLFIDIDEFKWVNDTWGHAAGDAVLRQAGDRLRNTAGLDLIGRVGGDEFVVSCSVPPASVAEDLRHGFAQPFALPDSGAIVLSCSIGVVAGGPDADAETMIADADMAMYAAKTASRDAVGYFTPQMRSMLTERSLMRQALVGALERDEFSVHLQPILDRHGSSVVGYEALLRWTRPGTGMVPPNEFIDVAEDANLLVPIGRWVIAQACTDLAVLRRDCGRDLFVSVNLSARQLQDPGLVSAVDTALAGADLPASALWAEITETTMVRNATAARSNIAELRRRGVSLALDDFGTGFASLAYLHDFDCQVVKVDRSFVSRLEDRRSGEAIVRSIVAMSHALDMTVVAEGVETHEQARHLDALGVDFMQGFYFGRPRPLAGHRAGQPGASAPRHDSGGPPSPARSKDMA